MKEEETRNTHFPRTRAKVILSRCIDSRESENLFGIRIEEMNKAWLRTWAFKIDETKAKHEGWDTEKITSSLTPTSGYNGCPFCGGLGVAQCGCGKLFCIGNRKFTQKGVELKCPWCGYVGVYQTAEAIDVQGGGF